MNSLQAAVPPITNNTITAPQTFCSSGDPVALIGSLPSGGDGTYTYQWQSSPDNSTWADIPTTNTVDYDPPTIVTTTYYRRSVISSGATTVFSASVQLTIQPAINNNTTTTTQSFCVSGDPSAITSSLPNGGSGIYTYQWQSSPDNSTWGNIGGATAQNYDPSTIAVTTYYRRGVSSGSCTMIYSTSAIITINPTIANNTISTAQSFCGSGDPDNLVGSLPTGGSGTYGYQWQASIDNSSWFALGITSQSYDPPTIASTIYLRRGATSSGSGCPTNYSSSVKLTVEPALTNNTITSSQSFCSTSDPAAITGPIPTGGNGTYSYQWQTSPDDVTWSNIGASNTLDYDPSTLSTTTYYRRGVSSGTCTIIYSSSVQISIESTIKNNTINSPQTFCATSDPAPLTSSLPTGGSGIYDYQWQSCLDDASWSNIGGALTQDYDPSTLATTTYYRRGVSSGSCGMTYSSSVKITILSSIGNNTVPSSQTFCGSGDPANLTSSTPTGGTGNYTYAWQASIDNSIWFSLGVSTQDYDPPLITSTIYLRRGVGSGVCGTTYSSYVKLTVEPTITSNTISSSQSLCNGGDPAAISGVLPEGGSGTYTYQWQSSTDDIIWIDIASAIEQNYDPTALSTTTYYRRGVSSGSCSMVYSSSIKITIEPVVANNIITSPQSFCANGNPTNLNGSLPTGGNNSYSYQWQSSTDDATWSDIGTGTSQSYDPPVLLATTYYRRGIRSGTCAFIYSTSIEIEIEAAIANNTIGTPQTFANSGDPAILVGSTPTGGNDVYSYQWQSGTDNINWSDIPSTNAKDFDPSTITVTTYYRRGVSSSKCAMEYSSSVKITIETELPLSIHDNSGIQNNSDILIYPNPFENSITISLKNTTQDNSYQLIDLAGRILKEEKLTALSANIDLSSLCKGVYLIKIKNNLYRIVKN